jgi:ATP-dependent DNA helicase RecG
VFIYLVRLGQVLGVDLYEAVPADGDATLLSSLQLDDGPMFKRATALLFGVDPERFVPGAYIKIGFFVSDDDLRYQDEMHGDLFAQVEKTLETLLTKYLKAYISYDGLHAWSHICFLSRHCARRY